MKKSAVKRKDTKKAAAVRGYTGLEGNSNSYPQKKKKKTTPTTKAGR